MTAIFNSLASIWRAYVMPPSLDAAQIEQATQFVRVRRPARLLSGRLRAPALGSRSSDTRTQSAIDNNRLVIWSKSHCPYCTRAKTLLQRDLKQDCTVRERRAYTCAQ